MVGVAGKSQACNTCKRRRVKVRVVEPRLSLLLLELMGNYQSATCDDLRVSDVRRQKLLVLDMSETLSSLIRRLRSIL
jgi:hypothetical protein